MHPYVYCDLHQSLRALPKILAITAALAVALRLLGGGIGVVLAFVILVPNLVVSLGAGSLSEELHKGPIRFLYGLPARRFDLWLIKVGFGLAAATLVVVLIAAVMLAFRVEEALGWMEIAESFEVDLPSVALLLAAVSAYNFAAGLFSATATGSTRTMGLANVGFVYLPLLGLWLCQTLFGAVPDIDGLSKVFFATALPFLLGSVWIFVRRNPFHERPWARRGWALGFLMMAMGVFGVALLMANQDSAESAGVRLKQPVSFAVSPDQQRVLVASQEKVVHTRGLVFDRSGALELDLGRGFSIPTPESMAWRPGSRQALFRSAPSEDLFSLDPMLDLPFVLLDLDTGSRRDVAVRSSEVGSYVSYLGWNAGGDALVGALSHESGDTTVFLHDIDSSSVRDLDARFLWEPDLHGPWAVGTEAVGTEGETAAGTDPSAAAADSNVVVDPGAPDGVAVGGPDPESPAALEAANAQDEDAEASSERRLLMVNTESGEVERRLLPAEMVDWMITVDGHYLVWVERQVDDAGARHAVLAEDLRNGEMRILLEGEALPSSSLAEAVRGRLASVSVTSSEHPDWALLQINSPTGESQSFLLSLRPSEPVVDGTSEDALAADPAPSAAGDLPDDIVDPVNPEVPGTAKGSTAKGILLPLEGTEGASDLTFAPGEGLRFFVTKSGYLEEGTQGSVLVFEILDQGDGWVVEKRVQAELGGLPMSAAWWGENRILLTVMDEMSPESFSLPRMQLKTVDTESGEIAPFVPSP